MILSAWFYQSLTRLFEVRPIPIVGLESDLYGNHND